MGAPLHGVEFKQLDGVIYHHFIEFRSPLCFYVESTPLYMYSVHVGGHHLIRVNAPHISVSTLHYFLESPRSYTV